jgi:hypothetical protein
LYRALAERNALVISNRFFARSKKNGAVLLIRPSSSHEFISNGLQDTRQQNMQKTDGRAKKYKMMKILITTVFFILPMNMLRHNN